MTKKLLLLDEVVIAAPCPVSWDSMEGNNRVRLCSGCSRNVYNISDMTSVEAEKFLQENGSSECMQIYRRPDGKIMTDNCPLALRKLRDRCRILIRLVSGLAATVLAFVPLERNSAAAQNSEIRGDVYIPPAKQTGTRSPHLGGDGSEPRIDGGAAAGVQNNGSCKKQIMLGPDLCTGQNKQEPAKPMNTHAEAANTRGLVAFPTAQENPDKQNPVKNIGTEKPDLRDARAMNFYQLARKSQSEGKSMLAQTQYLEALKAAGKQNNGDPKFKSMILDSCNSLRTALGLPLVDLEGKEIISKGKRERPQ